MAVKFVVGLFPSKGIAEDSCNRLRTEGVPAQDIALLVLRQTAPTREVETVADELEALAVDPLVIGNTRDTFRAVYPQRRDRGFRAGAFRGRCRAGGRHDPAIRADPDRGGLGRGGRGPGAQTAVAPRRAFAARPYGATFRMPVWSRGSAFADICRESAANERMPGTVSAYRSGLA